MATFVEARLPGVSILLVSILFFIDLIRTTRNIINSLPRIRIKPDSTLCFDIRFGDKEQWN